MTDDDYLWRLTRRKGDETAHLDLSSEYQDFEGPVLTLLVHRIGEGLIKTGTMMLQSRVDDDEEAWDE